MNNRDWLYTLQPRDRQRWLDAEHVEPNDGLSPKDGVSGGAVDVTTESCDSREKLEEGVYRAADEMDRFYCGGKFIDTRKIIGWLDRQAAITERECMERATSEHVGWDCAECAEGLGRELDARCDPLKERIAELQAKVDELNKKWANANMRCAEANAEAERWQQECNELKSRHCPHYHAHEHRCDVHETQIAELTAKVDGLTAERDMWRERCGRMLDAAHEIERIAEVDE